MIDEHPAHDLGGRAVKVRAIVQSHLAQPAQAQIRLVDERGRLKGVSRSLLAQIVSGQFVQLVVDERHQALECVGIAVAPAIEEFRDIAHYVTPRGCANTVMMTDHSDRRNNKAR
jgi:hypothetical protein